MRTQKITLLAAAAAMVCATAAPALGGRGASVRAISTAIASGSTDAIKAELERAETLPCAGCIDLVTPLIDHEDAGVRQVAAWFLVRRGIGRDIQIGRASCRARGRA